MDVIVTRAVVVDSMFGSEIVVVTVVTSVEGVGQYGPGIIEVTVRIPVGLVVGVTEVTVIKVDGTVLVGAETWLNATR